MPTHLCGEEKRLIYILRNIDYARYNVMEFNVAEHSWASENGKPILRTIGTETWKGRNGMRGRKREGRGRGGGMDEEEKEEEEGGREGGSEGGIGKGGD